MKNLNSIALALFTFLSTTTAQAQGDEIDEIFNEIEDEVLYDAGLEFQRDNANVSQTLLVLLPPDEDEE